MSICSNLREIYRNVNVHSITFRSIRIGLWPIYWVFLRSGRCVYVFTVVWLLRKIANAMQKISKKPHWTSVGNSLECFRRNRYPRTSQGLNLPQRSQNFPQRTWGPLRIMATILIPTCVNLNCTPYLIGKTKVRVARTIFTMQVPPIEYFRRVETVLWHKS